jgi:hypothetical protein
VGDPELLTPPLPPQQETLGHPESDEGHASALGDPALKVAADAVENHGVWSWANKICDPQKLLALS